VGTGDLPPELMTPGPETDHFTAYNAEVRMDGAGPELLHMPSWLAHGKLYFS